MSWLDDLLGKNISVDGIGVPDRKKLNFVTGAGFSVIATDNPGTGSTDVEISNTSGGIVGPLTVSYAAGVALTIEGDTTSPAKAALHVEPQDAQPTGSNAVGDIYVTSAGEIMICTTAGTPGTWQSAGWANVAAREDREWFGDGSDGDATITTNNATIGDWLVSGALWRDVYLNNLTISGSGSINVGGLVGSLGACRIFVSGILDISAAGAGAIASSGLPGTNASSTTGATATVGVQSGRSVAGGGNSAAGGNGGTAAGSAGGAISLASAAYGSSSLGGAGGSGSGGAGGAGGAITIAAFERIRIPRMLHLLYAALLRVGTGSPGGGGGGDGTAGGGGGSGGIGASGIQIHARTINRGGSTASGAIRATSGVGGNGFAAAAGNRGGGGGGGGGQGAFIQIVYRFLTGTVATTPIASVGGSGGNGGAGAGTGTAGAGGAGGGGGQILTWSLQSNSGTYTAPGAAVANSGATGGTGGTTSQNL